jgi:hypothetical protein
MTTVPDLLRDRGDPMAGLDDVPHDLSTLIGWADRDEAAGLAEPDGTGG